RRTDAGRIWHAPLPWSHVPCGMATIARPSITRATVHTAFFPGRMLCCETVMLRVLLLALALTSQCTWLAVAADVDWLCYTGPKEPGDPAIRCLPAGGGVAQPLDGWRGPRTRDAARTVDVTNRLGRVSVRVRGAARLLLAPAEGGATALA